MNARRTPLSRLALHAGCPVLLAAFLLVCAPLAARAEEPATVVFANQRGSVTFDHVAHQARLGDCQACHHAGQAPGSCRGCHVGAPGVPRSRDALHKSCKGCHLKTDGPIRCDDCHGKRSPY